jgi:CheY-like chemotaxis protein
MTSLYSHLGISQCPAGRPSPADFQRAKLVAQTENGRIRRCAPDVSVALPERYPGSHEGQAFGKIPFAQYVHSVLVVEDDPLLLRSVVRLLRHCCDHARVLGASTARRALEFLETQSPFRAVLSDHRLEGSHLTGAELLAVVAQRWPQTRRVLCTGDAELPFAPLAHRVLRKPAETALLIAALFG